MSGTFQAARAASARRRLAGAAVGAACWAVLAVAAGLRPDPSGVGTHEQTSLPPCEFLAETGWPCPTCGMTTSMAAMAHARPVAAFRAHPFGVVLFAACAATALLATAQALTGRALLRWLRPRLWMLAVAAGALAAGWGVKVLLGLADGSLPMR